MADIAVENNETPIVDKEVVEETTPESLKKIDSAAEDTESAAIAENGNADKVEEKKENGDAVDKPEEKPESTEEEHSNGDKKIDDDEDDDVEDTNGDSTDAPAEAVKRKVEESKTEETTATPEKKAKLDEAAVEKEVNGAEATELAAEA